MAAVTLPGLHKSFGATQVLRGVSLSVHDGEFLALVHDQQQDVIAGWYAFPGQNALRITDVINDHLQTVVAKRDTPDAMLAKMVADVQGLIPSKRA